MSTNSAAQYIEENKQVYDNIADQFSSTRQYLWEDLKPLAQYVNPGDKVIDLACGNGRLYQLLKEKQVLYVGTDQSEGLIREAQHGAPEATFLVLPMISIPVEDGEADAVYCIASFHHLPDHATRKKTLKEIRRVLKPGGVFVMTNWNLENDWVAEKINEGKFTVDTQDPKHICIPWRTGDQKVWGWRHYWSFSPPELISLLDRNGFTVDECYYSNAKMGQRAGKSKGMNIVTIARV